MIRKLRHSDMPRLRELGFDWPIGEDFILGLVYTDKDDQAVMVQAAWSRAEVHMATDTKWQGPYARFTAMRELHDAMEAELKIRKVGEVVTYFRTMESVCRRLLRLGWVKSSNDSWHRAVRGVKT